MLYSPGYSLLGPSDSVNLSAKNRMQALYHLNNDRFLVILNLIQVEVVQGASYKSG